MVFERSENEPEEYDPEAELEDPDNDSITIPDVTPEEPTPPAVSPPEVSVPSVDTDEADVPRELFQQFWVLVLVVNAAVLALSLGIMLLVIQGMVSTGGTLIVGGIVLSLLAVRRYWMFETDTDDDSVANDTEPGDDSP